MDQEQTASHSFEIRNGGTGELALRFASKSCGCTRVVLRNSEDETTNAPAPQVIYVPPDGKTYVEISWNTEMRQGAFRTSATLQSNDQKLPVLSFFIEGEVVPCIELSESQVRFTEVRPDETSNATIHVYSRQLDDLQITRITSSSEFITVILAPAADEFLKSVTALSGYRATVQIAPGLPLGPFSEQVTMTTNNPQRPTLTLRILGRTVGDVFVTPWREVDFHQVNTAHGKTVRLFVVSYAQPKSEIRVARATPEFLRVMIRPLPIQNEVTGRDRYELTAEILPHAPVGDFEGVIELETDLSTRKTVDIPVRGQVIE